jgi:hypothetical protein
MANNYQMGERTKTTLESTILDVWKAAAENGDSGEKSYEVGTDRYRKHTEDKTPGQAVEEEVIKFNGQDQLSSLKQTVMNMWQEAASSAVDPNDRDELDGSGGATGKAGAETAKKMKKAAEPKPMIATEGVEEDLTAKQKKIDLDKDGEIGADDLTKLRKRAKKEGIKVTDANKIELAQRFKVASMKEALAKVWGLDEHDSGKDHSHPHDKKEDKKSKTETGKKAATIELDPEISSGK